MLPSRQVPPDLAPNFRDLGGLRSSSGAVIVQGRLYRSASLVHLTPHTLDAVTDAVGPAHYFDLRTESELAFDPPNPLPSRGWTWHHIPVQDQVPGAPSSKEQAQGALLQYIGAAREIVATLNADVPGVVSCSLGKDRTGMVIALILQTLDINPHEITADYVFSNLCLANQRHLLPPRWRDEGAEIHPVTETSCLSILAAAAAQPPLLPADGAWRGRLLEWPRGNSSGPDAVPLVRDGRA